MNKLRMHQANNIETSHSKDSSIAMTPKSNPLATVNWEHLKRNQIFKKGVIAMPEEFTTVMVKGKEIQVLRGFRDLPPVLPFKIRSSPAFEASTPNVDKQRESENIV